jgi:hypothetical protein
LTTDQSGVGNRDRPCFGERLPLAGTLPVSLLIFQLPFEMTHVGVATQPLTFTVHHLPHSLSAGIAAVASGGSRGRAKRIVAAYPIAKICRFVLAA